MKSLRYPVTMAVGVAVAISLVLRALFISKEQWLWSRALPVRLADITYWARGAMGGRDGDEPYALIAIVVLQLALTTLAMLWLARRTPVVQAGVSGVLLLAVILLGWMVPLRPAWPEVATELRVAAMVVLGALAATAAVRWSMRRNAGLPALVAAALIPICFVSTTLSSLLDLPCILAPAMRLQHGFAPREVYLQYDLLPSLLAMAWTKLGGTPMGYSLVVGAGFYALLIGLFLLARRLFTRGDLAAPLLIALVVVRVYGVMIDANATAQATPMRLDLWLVLVAATLALGLRHWVVGAILGALFLFSRSMGTLYLGSYALALVGDWLAQRFGRSVGERPPLASDLRAAAREVAPALGGIAVGIIVARLVFGSFGSDAVRLYRRLGVGMMRIGHESFYWWLLPMTGVAGWLVYVRRAALPQRPGQARIFTVALLVANSLYFFGRSHEHNLINISASYLFCFFLALDLAWPASAADGDRPAVSAPAPGSDPPPALRWTFRATPWVLVAACAYAYSARVASKIPAQLAAVEGTRPLPAAFSHEAVPPINCLEIARASVDSRVYFFSKYDYWYYQTCGVVPQGFIQPLFLAIQVSDIAAQLNHVLDDGFKVVVPRGQDWGGAFDEMAARLGKMRLIETPNYRLYARQ